MGKSSPGPVILGVSRSGWGPGELGKRRSWTPVKWHAASEDRNSHSRYYWALCTATNNKQRQLVRLQGSRGTILLPWSGLCLAIFGWPCRRLAPFSTRSRLRSWGWISQRRQLKIKYGALGCGFNTNMVTCMMMRERGSDTKQGCMLYRHHEARPGLWKL